MPIRIKPHYDLKPGVLYLSSIEEITNIFVKSFPEVKFSANIGNLQIYDEKRDSFIEYISKYDSIESFSAEGQGNIDGSILNIKMIFDEGQASVLFDGSIDHNNWIEHFIFDVKKQLHEPSLGQRISIFFKEETEDGSINRYRNVRPYSRIILKQKKSQLIENIKANILSNIIWTIIGMFILYIFQWIL
jgi:hypothetical protein